MGNIIFLDTVKLDFKNRQDKNQLGFKNQIANDQVDKIDKNNLTLRAKVAVTKNVLKVKFDCMSSQSCRKCDKNIREYNLCTFNI